ncbi:hypothetical protein Q8F55_006409 [Vanrija albida]|uniref:Rab-GAP TBC domain-containing protein n=1 Tax=Vanrija albida TaxID=181172 RepID=A0ABR3PXD2_9TREE
MTTNYQDYLELLSAEQHVQVDKLREAARNGVLPKVRGEVWMYLLGVLDSDKTSEMTSLKALRQEYNALPSTLPSDLASLLLKTALAHHNRRFESPTYESLISSITAEPTSGAGTAANSAPGSRATSGYGITPLASLVAQASGTSPSPSSDDRGGSGPLVPPPTASPTRAQYLSLMEDVLGKYWHSADCQPSSIEVAAGAGDSTGPRTRWLPGQPPAPADWVYLATPFVCCLARPMAVFYGFEALMDKLKAWPPLPSRLGSVLGLFRSALPELHEYFEDEQVPMTAVAMSWMTSLLSREMWLPDVLRLWDSYLASDDMFVMHCYVCVAILFTCKETLEELDGSEAKLMLLDLPPLDVDRLLHDAANLKVAFPLPMPVTDDPDEYDDD